MITVIKNKDEFNDKLVETMEEIENCNPNGISQENTVFSDKAKKYIHKLAEYARNLELDCTSETLRKYKKEYEELEASASRIYIDMLYKICHAPTLIHMELVPLFLLPLIDERLNEGK